ncbi:hypothetical protein C499_14995 [Halogeometricum borinquense DSM 11551]|uniref:Inner membrane protein YgaP-like transmembrane domain-containing protein n=1 Tax=Halogeometricum borinquense (strain ATCC 700274 / DSM 11551 / JCM 10706 / KCTC 4070 / PR3) TaxID=469382 RepID=E4NTT6_HALBP|nr:DUF2892 domain-containing protein [Halogeometricum borinquense]ADQ68241.1 Protein of unknown function (DUF2892) [Halogeometricum borinquense DSM 11551]ELY24715.1 hypothetical protein C499_14995 [Halogeometricum borinquense DSM 11551]
MEKNVGGYDRIARLVVGPLLVIVGAAAVAGLFTIAAGTLGLVLAGGALVVGAVLLTTGLTQKCPLNDVIGMDTYRGKANDGR